MAKIFAKNKQLATLNKSLFDDGKTPLFEKSSNPVDPAAIICQEIFYKKTSEKKDQAKAITFILTDECLLFPKQKKNQTIYKRMIFLRTKLAFSDVNDPSHGLENQKMYFFRFSKNSKTADFYTTDAKIFETWKNFLRYKCILTTFHEDFEVKKMIGKGSFAKVYLATKKETGEEFAIKAFSKESLATQNRGNESLINEITIMRKLNHKNIIKLYEVYETTHSIYLVIELIKGGELMKKIKEKAQYSFLDIQKFLHNLLEALCHTHSKKIMHRDLKPENLILRSDENIYDILLVDFGLSSFTNIHPKDILFKRCGTPGFVAPEILSYKDGQEGIYDEKCDVFSAGVIFYLLLTGKKPFQGADYKDVLRANRTCDIDYNKEIFQILPKDTIILLKQMLNPSPEKRISSKEALEQPFFDFLKKQSKEEKDNIENGYMEKVKANLLEYNSFHLSSNGSGGTSHIGQDEFSNLNKDSIDNLKLLTRTPLLNGRIDTLEKITGFNSNFSLSSLGKNRSNSQKNHKNTNDVCESPSHFSGKKKPNRISMGKELANAEYVKEMMENSKKIEFLDWNEDDDEIPFEDPIISKKWPEIKDFEPKNLEIKE